jgi:predicted DNA-binding transcriptional regulator YafY
MIKKRTPRPDVERRLRQATRHARMLRILQLLLSRGRWNAKSIAAELECAERTVYRDLEVLALSGVPWYFDDNERCYRVRPDFRFPTIALTPDELLGQATATAISQGAGLNISSGAKTTTRKITAMASEDSAKLLNDAEQIITVLDLKLADHSRSHEDIRTVQWALLQRKQLAGVYASPYRSAPVKLTLNPLRLCLAQQAWYLIARPVNEGAPKTYRVTRFKSLRMLDTPSQGQADFDLKAYFGNAWAVYRGAESYDVAINFSPDAAPLVTETVWHSTQTVKQHKDGSVILNFQVDGLDEIVWWVLGWSGRAKVLKPERLREMVIEKLRAAVALHES